MKGHRLLTGAVVGVLATASLIGGAQAAEYPTKPVELIVP